MTATKKESPIAEVMRAVKRIPKSERNEFAKYSYAGADDVFGTLRPLLAMAGLVFDMTEKSCEFMDSASGKGRWAKLVFGMRLRIEAKPLEDAPPLEDRTCIVQVTGPQSFGAAATYTAKYYLRTKLLLDTGERDLDAVEKAAPPPRPKTEPQYVEIPDVA